VPRREDARLLTGLGRYAADVSLSGARSAPRGTSPIEAVDLVRVAGGDR
jgi:hypothetical protein